MSPEKLAYMANQIGRAFASQKHDAAVASVADHIVKFWDPRMRRAIVAAMRAGTVSLDPPVAEAVQRLREASTGPAAPPAQAGDRT